jgi:hypothetical protein
MARRLERLQRCREVGQNITNPHPWAPRFEQQHRLVWPVPCQSQQSCTREIEIPTPPSTTRTTAIALGRTPAPAVLNADERSGGDHRDLHSNGAPSEEVRRVTGGPSERLVQRVLPAQVAVTRRPLVKIPGTGLRELTLCVVS